MKVRASPSISATSDTAMARGSQFPKRYCVINSLEPCKNRVYSKALDKMLSNCRGRKAPTTLSLNRNPLHNISCDAPRPPIINARGGRAGMPG